MAKVVILQNERFGDVLGTPLAGYIADTMGRKLGVMFVLAAKAAGCFLIGLSPTPYMLMASSFATGLSGASYPVARAVLADVYSKDELPSMFGYLDVQHANLLKASRCTTSVHPRECEIRLPKLGIHLNISNLREEALLISV